MQHWPQSRSRASKRGRHCRYDRFLRPRRPPPRRSQSHWSSDVRQVRVRGLRRGPPRRRSRLRGRLAAAGGGYRLNSRRWASSDLEQAEPRAVGNRDRQSCGPLAVRSLDSAIHLRSHMPGTDENGRERPTQNPVFRGFASIRGKLQGSEPATFHRGAFVTLALLSHFPRFCGLFAVSNHEPSGAASSSSVLAQRQALSAAATAAARSSASAGSS